MRHDTSYMMGSQTFITSLLANAVIVAMLVLHSTGYDSNYINYYVLQRSGKLLNVMKGI